MPMAADLSCRVQGDLELSGMLATEKSLGLQLGDHRPVHIDVFLLDVHSGVLCGLSFVAGVRSIVGLVGAALEGIDTRSIRSDLGA